MAIMVKKSKGGGSHVDPDIYTALVVGVEEKEGSPAMGGGFLVWKFKIDPTIFSTNRMSSIDNSTQRHLRRRV